MECLSIKEHVKHFWFKLPFTQNDIMVCDYYYRIIPNLTDGERLTKRRPRKTKTKKRKDKQTTIII